MFFRLTLFVLLLTGLESMAADLKIETVIEGNGAIASTGKRASVHYKGMLSDGDVFDESRSHDNPSALRSVRVK